MKQHDVDQFVCATKLRLEQIDRRLFLFELRSGMVIFPKLDSTGMPTFGELMCVVCKGTGRPRELDHGALPTSMSLFGRGWGMISVVVDHGVDLRDLLGLIDASARRLVASVDANKSPRRFGARMKERVWHLRHKIAAFRAA